MSPQVQLSTQLEGGCRSDCGREMAAQGATRQSCNRHGHCEGDRLADKWVGLETKERNPLRSRECNYTCGRADDKRMATSEPAECDTRQQLSKRRERCAQRCEQRGMRRRRVNSRMDRCTERDKRNGSHHHQDR